MELEKCGIGNIYSGNIFFCDAIGDYWLRYKKKTVDNSFVRISIYIYCKANYLFSINYGF